MPLSFHDRIRFSTAQPEVRLPLPGRLPSCACAPGKSCASVLVGRMPLIGTTATCPPFTHRNGCICGRGVPREGLAA